jgi:hypothetical protein
MPHFITPCLRKKIGVFIKGVERENDQFSTDKILIKHS